MRYTVYRFEILEETINAALLTHLKKKIAKLFECL